MEVVGVPMGSVASACRVVRLREGQKLRGFVGRPAVGVLVHWAKGKSQLCVDALGRDSCPHCRAGDAPAWQAFVPVRHVVQKDDETVEVSSLLLLGSRSVMSGGLKGLDSLVGREVEFSRGRKRRFVEIQVMLEAEAFDHPVCQNLAVLFGAGRFWAECGTDAYRNLMESVNRMYSVERVAERFDG